MSKKVVIFDLDGTLSESAEGIVNSVVHAFEKMNKSVPDDNILRSFVGPPLAQSFVKHMGVDEMEAEQAVTFYREYYTEKGIVENHLYDGIHEILEKLKKMKIIMALATAKPLVYAWKILERCGIEGYFDVCEGSTLDGRMTDKGELIKSVLHRLSAKPEEALMIGDRYTDFEGAGKNGVSSAGAGWGYGNADELDKADHILFKPSDIMELLKNTLND